MLYAGRYHISIVFAFTCGRAKTIRIHYVWTRIFLKIEKKISVFIKIWIRVDRVLEDNVTYYLVQPPEGRQILRGKWVYAVKTGPTGEETHKAR